MAKETQLHLAQKELNKLKEQLKNAEITKAQALGELEKAKRTVDDLTLKLKDISESREAAKSQMKHLKESTCCDLDGTNGDWKEELETAIKRYTSVTTELDAAK